MTKKLFIIAALSLITIVGTSEIFARGNKDGPVVFVENQQLFYDAIVAAASLPMKGPFQELYECEVDGIMGLCTEHGPGDFGYYGGRWWVDNGNGIMDEDDAFFSCPLLGPGRETP